MSDEPTQNTQSTNTPNTQNTTQQSAKQNCTPHSGVLSTPTVPNTPHDLINEARTNTLLTALINGKNFSQACKEACVSRGTGYKLFSEWKDTEECVKLDGLWWTKTQEWINCGDKDKERLAYMGMTHVKSRMTRQRLDVQASSGSDSESNVVFDLIGPQELVQAKAEIEQLKQQLAEYRKTQDKESAAI